MVIAASPETWPNTFPPDPAVERPGDSDPLLPGFWRRREGARALLPARRHAHTRRADCPSETISYVILKRCFDIAFGCWRWRLPALPMLLIAAAVRLSSPGPVFFSQERVGINGQGFRMLKFRTMRVAPLERKRPRWTTASDRGAPRWEISAQEQPGRTAAVFQRADGAT